MGVFWVREDWTNGVVGIRFIRSIRNRRLCGRSMILVFCRIWGREGGRGGKKVAGVMAHARYSKIIVFFHMLIRSFLPKVFSHTTAGGCVSEDPQSIMS